MSSDFWNVVVAETYAKGKITVMKVQDGTIPEISESGLFARSVGEPKGQLSDWRTFKEGIESGVHAVEFEDRYELHVDLYDPHRHPFKHLLFDVGPASIALGIAAYCALRKLKGRN